MFAVFLQYIRWIFVAMAGLAAFMLQVSPNDVSNKLADWAVILGIPVSDSFKAITVPAWLPWGFWVVFGILIFWPLISKWLSGNPVPRMDVIGQDISNSNLAERDTKADNALAYIETGDWNLTFKEFMETKTDYEKGSSFNKFRQAALDGKFKVWGKTGPYSPHIPIEMNYWEIWKLEVFSCINGECKTEVSDHYNRVDKRYDLMVSKAEIEKTWPLKK